MLEPPLDAMEDPDESFGEEDHHEQQHGSVDDLVVLTDLVTEQIDVQLLEEVRQPEVEGGTEDRPPQRFEAPDDQHHEDPKTELDAELLRLGELVPVHV